MANQKKLRIVPLGGLEQIGMNITAFCYGESIIVVDCGLAFPEDDMLGIDLVIPDISFLREHADQVKAFFITHGHEDHIGALPYILRELPVPLYGTKLTLAIIRNKLEEYKMAEEQDFRVVSYGDVVSEGDFSVEFIRTNHSIADAAALAITCKAGTVIHTGDFKVDFTPVFGSPIDLTRFGELGKKGVLALMCDSTNALKPGNTMSERTVGKTFDTVFAENANHRIIVATFASNVDDVVLLVGNAWNQYGGSYIPCVCDGWCIAAVVVDLPIASLLYDLSDQYIQRLPAPLRLALLGDAYRLYDAAAYRHAQHL